MRYDIRQTTTYRYRAPVALQPHRLMLTPRATHELHVNSAKLHVTRTADLGWSQDASGNVVAVASFSQPVEELVIAAELDVEQRAAEWPIFRIDPSAHTYPFSYSEADAFDLGSSMGMQAADRGDQVARWARSFIVGSPTDTLSLLKEMSTVVGEAIAYRPREEEGTQLPLTTLETATGSCRDIASLFVEGVRQLGFAARAVADYLYGPDAAKNYPVSTHAWAEVYLSGAGWIAFDPTHHRTGSSSLIAVAVGRSNDRIMLITGGYTGEAAAALDMDVSVRVTRRMPG